MWPTRRMQSDRIQDIPEMATPSNRRQMATSTSQRYSSSDDESESDDEDFGADALVDLLLLTPQETYDAVQRPSTMRPLPCDCTETLQQALVYLRAREMASTSFITPTSPYMLYYPVPLQTSTTTELNDVNNSSNQQNNDSERNNMIGVSNDASVDSTLNNIARGPRIVGELSPKRVQRPARFKKTGARNKKKLPTPDPTVIRRRIIRASQRVNSEVANRVIKYARCISNMYERDMCCLNCGMLPSCPITGQCGHTRCSQCIVEMTSCPCGNKSPGKLLVNVLIRDLVEKTRSDGESSSIASAVKDSPGVNREGTTADTTETQPQSGVSATCYRPNQLKRRALGKINIAGISKRIPMSPRARYNHGLDLLRVGKHREAVPYLALAAASGQPDLQRARTLLAQSISVLSNNRDARRLTPRLNGSVRRLCSTAWIRPADMECILCCDTFTNPVTTPCGHMFCRTCLERTLDYRKRCPLCLRDLNGFVLTETENTLFVQAALKSINATVTPPPPEPDLIPIFVCTAAYPSVPCPLFIFDPRYWLMIRRVLESGSRKFGMVACDREQKYASFGTILEVRDCVHFEDGRSILSTVGLSRFKVIERGVRDGCDVARILPITDVIIRDLFEIWEVKVLARRIMYMALLWLSRLNITVLADIEAAFGRLQPTGFFDEEWWVTTDGPAWLWWLVAVLPLRSEIKVLILSTDCLAKRLLAVARTLEAVYQGHAPNTSPSHFELQSGTNEALSGRRQ